MYKNEFDNLLKEKKKFKIYMFYGQCSYLVEHYSFLLAKEHGSFDDIEKLYFDEYNFNYANDKLLQSSLFSSNNILLIKTDKKIPKKELDTLIESTNKNPHSILILSCIGDNDFKGMESSFSLNTNSVFVRFFHPSDFEAIKYLENKANELNLVYDTNVLNHLYFMHKNDLSLSINDLNKLSILNEEITISIIDKQCFGIGNVNFENLLHDLFGKKNIYEDLNLIFEEGMNEIFFLTQLTSFVTQLFMISSYSRTFGQPNPKDILGYIPPKNIWEKKVKIAINIKPDTFLKMFEYLLNLELELKSSKIDKTNSYLQASIRNFTALFR